MARPKKSLSVDQIQQVEKLASVLNQTQLAEYFEMSHTTFIEVCKRQPEVSLAYKKGRANAIVKVADSLIQQALDGNTSAQMFYLKTQAGWRETEKIDENGDPIPTTLVFNVAQPLED